MTTETQTSTVEKPDRPKTWLIESIFATLFCCLPFGIAGIIYASKVDSLYISGNYEEAEFMSQKARKWTKISFFVGLAVIVIYSLLTISGIMAAALLL